MSEFFCICNMYTKKMNYFDDNFIIVKLGINKYIN